MAEAMRIGDHLTFDHRNNPRMRANAVTNLLARVRKRYPRLRKSAKMHCRTAADKSIKIEADTKCRSMRDRTSY